MEGGREKGRRKSRQLVKGGRNVGKEVEKYNDEGVRYRRDSKREKDEGKGKCHL